jgi:hypothetical protein
VMWTAISRAPWTSRTTLYSTRRQSSTLAHADWSRDFGEQMNSNQHDIPSYPRALLQASRMIERGVRRTGDDDTTGASSDALGRGLFHGQSVNLKHIRPEEVGLNDCKGALQLV